MIKFFFLKFRGIFEKLSGKKPHCQDDTVEVSLPGLYIKLTRKLEIETPHEVTVVIPNAEISGRSSDGNIREYEAIYRSITIVHSPQAPLAGPTPTPSKKTSVIKPASTGKLTNN